MSERKKLLVYRICGLVLTILFFTLPNIINAAKPTPELINVECFTEYDETYGWTDCEVILTFNTSLNGYSGQIYIAFYDANEIYISQHSIYFYNKSQKTITETFTILDGDIEYYDVVDTVFYKDPSATPYIFYILAIFSFAFLISALLLSYKEYEYNGNKISVYAGFYHHTLKINNEIVDEHNTLIFITPISLDSIINDELVEAKISTMNRISLKINKKLIQPTEQKQQNNSQNWELFL